MRGVTLIENTFILGDQAGGMEHMVDAKTRMQGHSTHQRPTGGRAAGQPSSVRKKIRTATRERGPWASRSSWREQQRLSPCECGCSGVDDETITLMGKHASIHRSTNHTTTPLFPPHRTPGTHLWPPVLTPMEPVIRFRTLAMIFLVSSSLLVKAAQKARRRRKLCPFRDRDGMIS